MNRSQEMQSQVETLRKLFAENVDESRAYDQLSADARFGQVDRNTVKSVYKEEREKVVEEYSASSAKYEYSSVAVDSKDAVQDHGFGIFEYLFDKICFLNEHFAMILHAVSKDKNGKTDEEFHHLTVLDLFNNVVKFVF
jgi:hypothetical protein